MKPFCRVSGPQNKYKKLSLRTILRRTVVPTWQIFSYLGGLAYFILLVQLLMH